MASFNNDIDTQDTVHPPISIRNETEYENAVQTLNSLIDEVGTNEEHPLYTEKQDNNFDNKGM